MNKKYVKYNTAMNIFFIKATRNFHLIHKIDNLPKITLIFKLSW